VNLRLLLLITMKVSTMWKMRITIERTTPVGGCSNQWAIQACKYGALIAKCKLSVSTENEWLSSIPTRSFLLHLLCPPVLHVLDCPICWRRWMSMVNNDLHKLWECMVLVAIEPMTIISNG
jgi:hypothetical protein